MRISAKGEYGVRAILDIALYEKQGPVRVREIAARQAIPMRFLEQVMAALKKAALVESYRGAQGGYRLAKSSADISLADIVQAVEGPIGVMGCVNPAEKGTCDQVTACVIREVWQSVQNSVLDSLGSISLESVCEKQRKTEQERAPMFEI